MKTAENISLEYIEIPRGKSSLVKLDILFEQRMRDFVWERVARFISFSE